MGDIAKGKSDELVSALRRSDAAVLYAIEMYSRAYEHWLEDQAWIDEHGDVGPLSVNSEGKATRVGKAAKLDAIAQYEASMETAMKTIRMYL
jgi:hypothetical protein